MDPFAVLGLPRDLDLDATELERRYLALLRETHPDRHRATETDTQGEIATRAASVNDAYRVLRDPWRRAEALLELLAPGGLERHKQLSPAFLASALDLAEEVAGATPIAATRLRAQLEDTVAADFAAVRDALARGDHAGAATRIHQARYHRKALADLAP